MKQGLYICFEFDIENRADKTSGIAKKIKNQFEVFHNNGYEMTFYNPYTKLRTSSFFKIKRRIPLAGFFIDWDTSALDLSKYDFVYIRKPWFMQQDLLRFLRGFRNLNSSAKIIVEVPTYPYDYEVMSWKDYTLLWKDKLTRKKLHKYVNRVTTYSDDAEIFGIKTININNGVRLSEEIRRNDRVYNENELNIVAVSNLGFWHGYDRAIEGLRVYYSENHKIPVKLHVVGDGMELEKLKNLVKNYHLEEYVTFYGRQSGEKLDEIYSICQVGIDSLGRHRSKVTYNSSLKSKEYLAKGLIVVSGVKNELDNDTAFKYYFRVPSDETPIDYKSILEFCRPILTKVPQNEIREELIDYVKNHFDFEIVMKPIISYLGVRK